MAMLLIAVGMRAVLVCNWPCLCAVGKAYSGKILGRKNRNLKNRGTAIYTLWTIEKDMGCWGTQTSVTGALSVLSASTGRVWGISGRLIVQRALIPRGFVARGNSNALLFVTGRVLLNEVQTKR